MDSEFNLFTYTIKYTSCKDEMNNNTSFSKKWDVIEPESLTVH